GRDDGVPALVEIGADALVQELVDVGLTLAVDRGVAGMDRGAVDAAVQPRGRGGGELAVGARRAAHGAVEDVLVGAGARLEGVGPATAGVWQVRKETSCGRVTMSVVDQPASSSACSDGGAASRGCSTSIWVCSKAALRRGPSTWRSLAPIP